ncbi:MAG: InlB B-repeat-containing protein [Clostridiales Family XIII bacterium]|jgi:uncharacterized repeat protein (TIGR02543 family)|nr:InlB B-repeat-containing protein [Clostridiales Family XIII bacterium]
MSAESKNGKKKLAIYLCLIAGVAIFITSYIFISQHARKLEKEILAQEQAEQEAADAEKEKAEAEEPEKEPLADGEYRVSFDPDGGTFDINYGAKGDDLVVTAGLRYGTLPVPVKDGYIFAGWYTESGARIGENSVVALTADTALTAHYITPDEVNEAWGLPVFMYHYLYDPAQGETSADSNHLNLNLFKQHLAYLKENDFYYPTWNEVYAYVMGVMTLPEKSVVLTSDDAAESFFRLYAPAVEEYGGYATSFMVTYQFDAEFVRANTTQNIIFRSHTHDMHRAGADGKGRIMTLSHDEIVADLTTSGTVLMENDVLAYPFGHYNDAAEQAVADAGIRLAFTTEYGVVRPGMDPLALPRIRVNEGMSVETFAAVAG